jgi:hypothetical protein
VASKVEEVREDSRFTPLSLSAVALRAMARSSTFKFKFEVQDLAVARAASVGGHVLGLSIKNQFDYCTNLPAALNVLFDSLNVVCGAALFRRCVRYSACAQNLMRQKA